MGIPDLHKFINDTSQVKNGCTSVNMLQCIKKHSSETLIVIDLEGLLTIFTNKNENLCGIRSDVFLKRTRKFFHRLVTAGAKLAFFGDGPIINNKQETWFNRKQTKYNQKLKFFDKINEEGTIAIENLKYLTPPMSLIKSLLKKIAKEFGPLIISMEFECDSVLAAYATKNNAYAVLTDDTDFLIYPGNWKVWSIKALDKYKFNTLQYNPVTLRRALGLTELQMPLFAALCGNDIISNELLERFHRSFQNDHHKFMNIANFVKKLPVQLTDENWNEIGTSVFSQNENFETKIELLKESYEMYDIKRINFPLHVSGDEEPNNEIIHQILSTGQNDVYIILKQLHFKVPLLHEDMREVNYTKLLIELRRRMIGVILKHRNDPNIQSKVIVKQSHEQPYEEISITPIYPEIEVPPLDDLLFPEIGDGLDSQRKLLLQWILSGTKNNQIDTDKLFTLRTDYICTVATLFFLVKEADFPKDIADVVLLSIEETRNKSMDPKFHEAPKYLVKDAFIYDFVFLRMYILVEKIFKIVGLGKYLTLVQFDGFVFHNLYQAWLDIENARKINLIKRIDFLRLYDM
uniref:CSON013630 protein n=1 Tax=Culicoides sonorensis TaxID=179676 RepID=A0A336MBB3_CULSO